MAYGTSPYGHTAYGGAAALPSEPTEGIVYVGAALVGRAVASGVAHRDIVERLASASLVATAGLVGFHEIAYFGSAAKASIVHQPLVRPDNEHIEPVLAMRTT